MNQIRAEERRI